MNNYVETYRPHLSKFKIRLFFFISITCTYYVPSLVLTTECTCKDMNYKNVCRKIHFNLQVYYAQLLFSRKIIYILKYINCQRYTIINIFFEFVTQMISISRQVYFYIDSSVIAKSWHSNVSLFITIIYQFTRIYMYSIFQMSRLRIIVFACRYVVK